MKKETLIREVRRGDPPGRPYIRLLERVRKKLAEGRARAKRALEYEEVRTWWETAKIVNDHLRIYRGRAKYGKQVVFKLAHDLRVGHSYLYDILQFQKNFPIFHSSGKLTLTHYRIMARVEDPRQRRRLYLKVRRENLSVPALVEEIRKRRLLSGPALELPPSPPTLPRGDGWEPAPVKQFRPLIPRRGKFYTYQIVKPRGLHEGPDFYSVDLGFRNRFDLKLNGIQSPKEGDVIEAVRIEKNERGDRYRFRRLTVAALRGRPQGAHIGAPLHPEISVRVENLLYTYKATVRDVLDDDTLWADIDLGFRVWTERKLRLRGIDAAEIKKGKPASDFVKRTLARVPFIVLTATGRDKFGRPLVDLFYLEGAEDQEKVLREGIYLNQQLLDLGLAKRV